PDRPDSEGLRKVPSIARVAAGAFGFLTLIHVLEGPERYGAFGQIYKPLETFPRPTIANPTRKARSSGFMPSQRCKPKYAMWDDPQRKRAAGGWGSPNFKKATGLQGVDWGTGPAAPI